MLGHAMLLTLRGVPTIYYGDEQGFVGKGGDQDLRQDMFASKLASYNSGKLLGTTSTTAQANFNPQHPLYREISRLARIRTSLPRLDPRIAADPLFVGQAWIVCSLALRPVSGREMLLLFNTSLEPVNQHVRVETRSREFEALAGTCPLRADAPGSVSADLPALGYAVCNAR